MDAAQAKAVKALEDKNQKEAEDKVLQDAKDIKKKQADRDKSLKAGRPADFEEVKAKNEGVDPYGVGNWMNLHLPSGSDRPYLSKPKYFPEMTGRDGTGPCTCLIKFNLPNGDQILPEETFDPEVERMAENKYRSLLARKFITKCKDQKKVTKLDKPEVTK